MKNQHEEMLLLKDHVAKINDELWLRQLEEYPDSVRRSFHYVLTVWLNSEMPETFREEQQASFKRMGMLYDGDKEFRRERANHVNEAWQRERNKSQMGVLLTMQNVCGVFYECGLNADGTYKYTGFRYGFDGWEYQSSICDVIGGN